MANGENPLPLGEQLYWAERHAADHTMADHNREWFKAEAERMREQGVAAVQPALTA